MFPRVRRHWARKSPMTTLWRERRRALKKHLTGPTLEMPGYDFTGVDLFSRLLPWANRMATEFMQ
jgi:hypothetical protein